MKIVIDINPPHRNFCVFGYEQCDMYDGDWKWCNVYRKVLDEYNGQDEHYGDYVRCTECHEAEREAKNDCKNNADA